MNNTAPLFFFWPTSYLRKFLAAAKAQPQLTWGPQIADALAEIADYDHFANAVNWGSEKGVYAHRKPGFTLMDITIAT